MNFTNRRVLVTGGAGFIGSHIVTALVKAGAKVTVFDNLSFGTLDNLREVRDDIACIRGDILDPAALATAMRGMEVVSHHAAQLEIFLSTETPGRDLTVNTLGTLNVLEAAKRAGVDFLVNASSACVYGQKSGPTVEDDPRHPNWAYGVSKLAAEEYGRLYAEQSGLPVVSLRYAIVYGEREWLRRALPLFLKRAGEGKPPVVFGRGEAIRDFIHVADVVRFHNACIGNDQVAGRCLNVGSGTGTSIAALAGTVCDLFLPGQTPVFEACDQGQMSRQVPGKRRNLAELKSMILDPGLAGRLLGVSPAVDLPEGLRREFDWAMANPGRWANIVQTKDEWNV